MTTSLQKQLATLRATRTNELDLKAQKIAYSKSLLFEPSVAASQSLDSLFQICHEGFEELCSLDARFFSYQRSLFGPASKSQDRSLMTATENQDLSRLLESCMILLSSRLSIKPAQKAVEWLIRRFKIHELDTENFVLAFLPHHSSELFAAVLSILPTTLPPSLRFLSRYINTLQKPSREAFVQAFIQNPSFFSAFGNHVVKVAESGSHSHALLSMWAAVTVQGVYGILQTSASAHAQLQRQREDDLCARLFPIVNGALAVKRAPGLILGCCMIIVVLVTNSNLNDETLDALMEAVCESVTSDTGNAGISCLAQIAQSRNLATLPPSVLLKLLERNDLCDILLAVSKQQSIHNLALCLLNPLEGIGHAKYQDRIADIARTMSEHRTLPLAVRDKVGSALGKRAPHLEDGEDLDLPRKRPRNISPAPSKSQIIHGRATPKSPADLRANETQSHFRNQLQPNEYDVGRKQAELPEELVSFLSRSSRAVFARLHAQLQQSGYPGEHYEAIFGQDLFTTSEKRSFRILTFLIRAWCTSPSSTVRASAVRRCEELLHAENQSRGMCAFLVPYVLLALKDRASKTRAAASKLMVAMKDLLLSIGSEEPNDGYLNRIFQTIYGTHYQLPQEGSTAAIRTFCRTITDQGLEECVMDSSRVGQLLSDLLGTSSALTRSHSQSKAQKMKSSHKDLFYRSMANHVTSLEDPSLTASLLGLMSSVDKVTSKPRSQYLIAFLRRLSSTSRVDLAAIADTDMVPSEYIRAMLAIVHPRDEQSLSFLVQCATSFNGTPMEEVRSEATIRLETLWPQLNSGSQDLMIRSIVEAAQAHEDSGSVSVGTDYSLRVLRSLSMPSSALELMLQDLLERLENDSGAPERPQTKAGMAPIPAGNTSSVVEKLSFTLDLVQSNSSRVTLTLFHRLFELLAVIRILSTRTSTDLDYLLATNLDCLDRGLQHLEDGQASPRLDLSIVRADVLVDCVRGTSSTQTRNSALLLLSKLVKYDASLVLHTVMPIFTLMTSTTVRQSDALSMHIVDTTVQSIIPSLSAKLQEQRKDIASSTADILSSFATAFDHIQPHRRLQLFSLLAGSLGPHESLFAIFACLVEQKPGDQEVIDFLSVMLMKFQPVTILVTVVKYLTLILNGWQEKHGLFQVLSRTEYAGPEKDMILSCHLRAISSILHSSLVQGRLNPNSENEAVASDLPKLLSECMEKAISISLISIPTAQSEAQQIISSLLFVFPLQHIAAAVEPLLSHSNPSICRGALTTLGKRIRSIKKPTSSAVQSILSLLPRLGLVLSTHGMPLLRTSALACIDCICERFGKIDSTACVNAIQAIAKSDCTISDDTLMRSLSLQCFASAVENLGNDFVPLLGMAMQAANQSLRFAIMKDDDRLHSACFALYSAIVDHLPYVVSRRHLVDQLEGAVRSTTCRVAGDAEHARQHCLRLVAIKIDLTAMLPAINAIWPMALSSGGKAMAEINELLRSSINARSKAELQRSSRAIADLLLLMLDLPRQSAAQSRIQSDSQNGHLDSDVRQSVIAYVLKINDTTFRPFFARLVGWASTAVPSLDHDRRALRMRVMFEVLHSLSEALKSIFTTYFNNVVEHAVTALDSTLAAKSVGHGTKLAVLRALTSSFKYDQDDFWQAPARFNAISGPLVAQLTTTPLEQIESHVVPCVIELAADASTPESHKTLNSMILRLLQSEHARVRLSAVKCQASLVGRLGDDWLANLPEMLPVINELQDDDDEKVERETRRWIKAIEQSLGESLSSMLQ